MAVTGGGGAASTKQVEARGLHILSGQNGPQQRRMDLESKGLGLRDPALESRESMLQSKALGPRGGSGALVQPSAE